MRRAFFQNLWIREDTIAEDWLKALPPAATDRAEEWAQRIPESLAQVFAALEGQAAVPAALLHARTCVPSRDCAHNPWPGYFVAGEEALRRGVAELESRLPPAARRADEAAELLFALRYHARREIDDHCRTCAHRGTAHGCRYAREKRAAK